MVSTASCLHASTPSHLCTLTPLHPHTSAPSRLHASSPSRLNASTVPRKGGSPQPHASTPLQPPLSSSTASPLPQSHACTPRCSLTPPGLYSPATPLWHVASTLCTALVASNPVLYSTHSLTSNRPPNTRFQPHLHSKHTVASNAAHGSSLPTFLPRLLLPSSNVSSVLDCCLLPRLLPPSSNVAHG